MFSELVQSWQYFDFIVIGTVTIVVAWLMLTHRKKKGALLPSISQTIAADKNASLLFSVMMTVCVPLYYSFIWFWLGPKVVAPWYFYALVAASFVAEMVFVWVPATSGKSKKIHELNAWFVGLVMFAAPLILLLAAHLSKAAIVATITFLALSLVMLLLLAIPRMRKYTLTYEIIYCVLFWALMSYIAHS